MKWFLALVLFLFATESFADDWRMRKFDMNMDGFVTKEELIFNGRVVKNGLFKYADKNDDGKLSKKELRKATNYMVRNRCPRD